MMLRTIFRSDLNFMRILPCQSHTCPLLPSAEDKPLILFIKMFMIDVHSEICIIS